MRSHRFATLLTLFTLSVLLAMAAVPASAATYYLSPTGNDANSGSSGSPWKTPAKAAATMVAGDTVLLADGDYAGGFKQTRDGTASAKITFKAVNPGRAVLRGDLTTVTDGITVYQANHVVFDGLVLHKWKRAGMSMTQSKFITVRNCIARYCTRWGIFSGFCDDLLIENNICFGSVQEHGIYVSNSGDRPVVRYNTCYDNPRAGIQLNGDGSLLKPALGAGGDGIIDGAVVTNNILYDNGPDAAGINLMSVRNSLFANNLLHSNTAGGISMSDDGDGNTYGCKNNKIYYNTIYFHPADGRWCLSFTNGSTGNLVKNNILWGGYRGAYQFDNNSSITADYNVLREHTDVGMATNEDTGTFYRLSEWRAATGDDAHSTTANPLFINTTVAPYDFRVDVGSPAIDKGTVLAEVIDDLQGAARTFGTAPDIGAYESLGEDTGGNGAPTGLAVTLGLDLKAYLSWNTTVPGATYSVKRALLPGGPYTRIAKGLTKTTYTSGGLLPGVLYWYVVSSTVDGVESPDSEPVSVLIP